MLFQAAKDLKALIPLIFRQYLANVGLDRALPVPSSTKRNPGSGKTLAALAFEALELSLSLLSTKFGLDVAAEIADAVLEEMRNALPQSEEIARGESPGEGASQSDANVKISKCIQHLQQEFDKLEGQAEYDQARQILCALYPFMNMLPNDILVDHLVIVHFHDVLLGIPVTPPSAALDTRKMQSIARYLSFDPGRHENPGVYVPSVHTQRE